MVSPNVGNFDSVVLATQTFNDFVIPHWPPLYPLFIRTINFLTASVLWLFGGTAPGFVEPTFNWITLKFILLIQHGLAIVAAAYAASQFRLSLIGSRCVAAVLYLNPFMLICIHSLFSPLGQGPQAFCGLTLASCPLQAGFDWRMVPTCA